MKPWEVRLAHLSHGLLYVLFFAAPLTGWLFSSAAGFQTVYLGVLPIPDLLSKNKELADVLKSRTAGSTTPWPPSSSCTSPPR